MVNPLDPYATLQVPRSATAMEIKRAYRTMARKYHPDKCSTTEQELGHASAKFSACAEAFAILSDPQRKAEYDHIYKYGGYDCQSEVESSQSPIDERHQKQQQSRPQNYARTRKSSTGIGYACHDPCAFLWTQGRLQSRQTIAGVQIPSRFQSVPTGFRFAFTSGQVVCSPSGTTKCISETTQYFPLVQKKLTLRETVTFHPDGRKEVIVVDGEGCERQFSSYRNVSQQKELPWYTNAWNQIQDKLSMCYNPCAAVEARQ